MEDKINLIQISDTHLYGEPYRDLFGVNTRESLAAVVEKIKLNRNKLNVILHSGDISQDYSRESYKQLADLLEELQVPVYCLPGNHDDMQIMQEVYPFKQVYVDKQVIISPWQLILLNTQIEGKVEGELSESELEFMEKCLQEQSTLFSIIALHHHPIPVKSPWMDKIALTNANDFWQRLQKYTNVKAVFFGHVHQTINGEKNHIQYFSAPSTCVQFKQEQPYFELDFLAPGYRLIELFSDGGIQSEVFRIENYIGQFHANPKVT